MDSSNETTPIISSISRIDNGSLITIGKDTHVVTVFTSQHFNWLQKKMLKWCFGFTVKDYSDTNRE